MVKSSTCLPIDVTFTDITTIPTQPISSTTWTFGDNPPIPLVSNGTAFHQYTVLGTYNASVLIKNAGGCVYTGSQSIAVNGSPTGTWIHDTGYVCNNATVNFTVNGNSFTDSVIIDYQDGNIVHYPYSSTNNSFPHIYLSGGDRNPTVILKSLNGCEFPLNAMGTIRVDYPKAAYLDPIPQDNTPCGYSIVTFKNQSRADQNVANAQYVWKIDGVSYTFKDSVFRFTTTGSHTVQLQINSVSGCTDITAVQTFNVQVNNIPNILNVTRIDSACANQTIFYTANVAPSQDPITNYIWTFGNGTTYTSTTNTANTVYGTAANNYIDRLIVATANCRDTLHLPKLVINPTPSVSINTNNLTVCEKTPIPLTATANLPCTFDWFPKNAGLSPQTGATVTATPIDTIQYWVNGYTAYGCMDSASINIGVMHQPILTINKGMKDSICLGDIVELKVISTPDNGNHDYIWSPRGINSYIIDTGVNAGLGPIIHVQPKVNITYVVSDKSTACGVITPATIAIAVGDTLHVSFNTDVVHLQSNQKYTLTPFYSDAIKSTIWSPNAYFTAATGYTQPYPEVDVINNVCYSVDATSIYGCKATDTLCIVAFCEASQVFIPNAFTPDGSGTNDYFYITATGISKVTTFRVFNRWGQVVFERANFIPPAYKSAAYNAATAWDGKVNGIVAPTDTYVYTCEVECANGTKFVYTGSVTLIK
jgi:gliding motility-associated-like protein